MKTLFSADFFSQNRQKLRNKIPKNVPIVITANGQLQRSADTMFPFQQDANFRYLTGINEPDLLLVIDNGEEYLILPEQSVYQKIFDGEVTDSELSARSGIAKVYDNKSGWKLLKKTLKTTKEVAVLTPPPQYIDVYGMYTNPARWALRRGVLNCNDSVKFIDAREALTDMRMVKQESEIEAIRKAIEITGKGLEEVVADLRAGKFNYEYQVEAGITQAFRTQDSNHAFDPIIASGKRACILHNTNANGLLKQNELLLFDIGAEYEGYAADISRTVSISGILTDRQQQVAEAVKITQDYAYTLLKPGVSLHNYEREIEKFIGEQLIKLDVISKASRDEIRKYYPHAASHHLGLDVHDAYNPERKLEENMVITVEPGIYIPEEGIGVRIEDDVRITKDGVDVLSQDLPTSSQ